jgi:hypothetical protein
MKLLSLIGLVLLLATLLAPVGHGARQVTGRCLGRLPMAPVHIIRSPRAALAPKTVRSVPTQAR